MARRHYRRRRNAPARHHRVRRHHRRRRQNPHVITRYLMRNEPRRRQYRHRRNPNGLRKMFTGEMFQAVVGTGAGYFGTRMIPATFFKEWNRGVTGYVLNIGAGLTISWALSQWNRAAGAAALVGTGVAVVARILTEQFGIAGLQGDLEYDLGYYVSDRFPYPQGAAGPYDLFPGSPSLLNPPFPATSAAAVRAGAAAAAAALPAAAAVAPAAGVAGYAGGRWGAARWS